MPQGGMGKAGDWRCIWALAAALLVPVALGLALLPSPLQAQSSVIRDIRVEGNRRVEPETVRSYLRFIPGDPYDAGKVDQSIKALFATGLFTDVRIDRSGTGVVMREVENPGLNRVELEGNRE